ncbi:YigZ family protein [Mollicutes bacterium LVI A0078]|nr:YigZ family protein [Mollicutes bacterium LVI A0075]WOO90820.1 YigZ family protein [Mollicutes bacterium LVI A0078]
MKSLKNEQITEVEVKKSRFICYMKNISSEEEAKQYIADLKKQHPTAAHHCSAYRVGSIDRANDDGEPSQTAGMPMLNVLTHNDLINTIAVVVRYFGGVKLGAGGLVRAYTDSVVAALDEADVAELTPGYSIRIKAGYSDIDKINYILQQEEISQFDVDYGQVITYNLEISTQKYEQIFEKITSYNHMIKIEICDQIIVVKE